MYSALFNDGVGVPRNHYYTYLVPQPAMYVLSHFIVQSVTLLDQYMPSTDPMLPRARDRTVWAHDFSDPSYYPSFGLFLRRGDKIPSLLLPLSRARRRGTLSSREFLTTRDVLLRAKESRYERREGKGSGHTFHKTPPRIVIKSSYLYRSSNAFVISIERSSTLLLRRVCPKSRRTARYLGCLAHKWAFFVVESNITPPCSCMIHICDA